MNRQSTYKIIDIWTTTDENEVEHNDVFPRDKHHRHVIPSRQHVFPNRFRKITDSIGAAVIMKMLGLVSRELLAHVISIFSLKSYLSCITISLHNLHRMNDPSK